MAKKRPVLTEEQREQRRAEQRELVVASIEQLRSSDGWRAYLAARARFRSYSARNVLLILQQHPVGDAGGGVSGVAGPRVVRDEGVDGDPDLGAVPTQQTPAQGVARRRRRPGREAADGVAAGGVFAQDQVAELPRRRGRFRWSRRSPRSAATATRT